jgi:serine/threonine protein kinase
MVPRKEQSRLKHHRGVMMFQRSSSRSSITTSSLRERSEVLLDLAKRIAYLHSRRILHRDLKPCNIGFDHDGVLKLFDFDVSRVVPFSNNPNKDTSAHTTRQITWLHESRSGARVFVLFFPRRIGGNGFCNVRTIVGSSRFPNVRR